MNTPLIETIEKALQNYNVMYGNKIKPWYIVLGRQEISRLTADFEARPRLGFPDRQFKTPNRYFSFIGEHRIVAIPFESHFSLGFDPDVANHFDQLTPFWSIK